MELSKTKNLNSQARIMQPSGCREAFSLVLIASCVSLCDLLSVSLALIL
jgi:hypothetical protein